MTENEKKQIDAILQTNEMVYKLKAENELLRIENEYLKKAVEIWKN